MNGDELPVKQPELVQETGPEDARPDDDLLDLDQQVFDLQNADPDEATLAQRNAALEEWAKKHGFKPDPKPSPE